MDNPKAFANCIINDVFGENLEVDGPNEEETDYQNEFLDEVV